ncbi:OsmC family protein [Tenacibaculum finnmarkense]|uniref:OsmC family protein n=1 Tax=Tenacibaculum finnmarkense TaxID=2781243 RepID=UPI001EFA53DE|nr:OsmC family protein [Tenacibaculum finnmarkense]MCG8806312.1 OsmC family protein [Tenacibaculum finnmarkense]MCG8857521.1 OsmC family protein [Tenacibaculum finnmarkense]WCC46368.1 OsmC family protein [Tenacibaculum finnmarkense]
MAAKASSKVLLSNRNYVAEAKMRNHFVITDQPVEKGGDNNGPTPVEYLLTAIGGCVSITLRTYAENKKWDVGEITVNVTQQVRLTSQGIKKSLLEEISFEKELTKAQKETLLEIAGTCPVAQMVKGRTEIVSSIQ